MKSEEEYRREEIREYLSKRFIKGDIESGLYYSGESEMEDLFLDFMNYLLDS